MGKLENIAEGGKSENQKETGEDLFYTKPLDRIKYAFMEFCRDIRKIYFGY